MRFIALAVAAVLFATATPAEMGPQPLRPKALEAFGSARSDCSPTVAQRLAKQVQQQDGPQLFHRLDKLPPATAYAAVVRKVDGCEVPLTMVEYRSSLNH